MTEENGTLRLRMVEPLDMNEATRTLTRAGLLVPLTDWSARKRRFDTHPRGLGILTALLVPVGIAGWASLPTSSVSTPAAVGAGVAAFVLGIALEVWIATHHPPVPETPAQVLSDVFGVDAAAPRTGADLDLLVETAKNYAYGRGGFDLPQAEVRADWTLTSPDAGAICGQAWSSDVYDYCTGCGVLLNEDCESAVPGWCVWCAGEE